MSFTTLHQYVCRNDRKAVTELLFSDRVIKLLYSPVREKAPAVFNLLLSKRFSALLGYFNYDFPLSVTGRSAERILKELNVTLEELYLEGDRLDTYRKIFERRIRYWDFRPMDNADNTIVSVADARVLPGSFCHSSALSIKDKMFDFADLIGPDQHHWQQVFEKGDFAVFRLTPDQYHYNHAPVSGVVKDIYEINGLFHSCNPGAIVKEVTPYSKNRRVVTIIDTDVENGSRTGLVAMIEIAALMIGDIVQCYSSAFYDQPVDVRKGTFLKKGQPKSLFKPGSSTTVLIFEKNHIRFNPDLIENRNRKDVSSRFSEGFAIPMVETDIRVRETIGEAI